MPGVLGVASLDAMKKTYPERRIRIDEVSVEALRKANKLSFAANPISMSAGKLTEDGKLKEVDRLILCPGAADAGAELVPLEKFKVVRSVSTKFIAQAEFETALKAHCSDGQQRPFAKIEKSWSLLAGLASHQTACSYKETLADGTIRFLTFSRDTSGSKPSYTRIYRAVNDKFCPLLKAQ